MKQESEEAEQCWAKLVQETAREPLETPASPRRDHAEKRGSAKVCAESSRTITSALHFKHFVELDAPNAVRNALNAYLERRHSASLARVRGSISQIQNIKAFV
jgi:antitoxin component HigA of HigAB toxin-antitoxin module